MFLKTFRWEINSEQDRGSYVISLPYFTWGQFDHTLCVHRFGIQKYRITNCILENSPELHLARWCALCHLVIFAGKRSRELWVQAQWREVYRYSVAYTTNIVLMQIWLKVGISAYWQFNFQFLKYIDDKLNHHSTSKLIHVTLLPSKKSFM